MMTTRPLTKAYSAEEQREIVEHVIANVSSGRNVSRILREDEGMPSSFTFYSWLNQDEELSRKLERARELGVEAILDEVIDIVDDASDDAEIIYREGVAVGAKVNGTAIRRASLQAEMRVKMAQMMKPRKYGAKLDLTSAGEKLEGTTQLNDNRLQAIVGMVAQRKAQAIEQQPPKGEDDDDVDPFS